MRKQVDPTSENILGRLRDTEHYPDEALAPYKEFSLRGKAYYLTPGGFFYRRMSLNKQK